MGKFKVGDRVRAIHSSSLGLFLTGHEYEVLAVRHEKITAINEHGQRDSWGADHFELLPVAAQTFKVGDRVRTEGWSRFYEVVRVGDGHIWVKLYDGNSSKESTAGKTFEFEAAPLKIEAGKYYRTRDGRKVGPIVVAQGNGKPWPWKDATRPFYYRETGYSCPGAADLHNDADDLIAEWIDEPVKVAAPVAKPAIVALIENGQPKPSVAPFVHANETLAAKEATRLANLQKGKEFGVYVLTQKASEPAPSYKHEWQRFAAKGEKISAIKELRSVTGLGLRAAKDAVEYWIAHDEPYSRIAA